MRLEIKWTMVALATVLVIALTALALKDKIPGSAVVTALVGIIGLLLPSPAVRRILPSDASGPGQE